MSDAENMLDDFIDGPTDRLVLARYRKRIPQHERAAISAARKMQDEGLLSIETKNRMGLIHQIAVKV